MGVAIAVSQDTFETEVVQRSYEKPVLVDFFAQWCGPCQMLKPILEQLAQEYDIVVAKVDIDQNPELAQDYGVQGVPDVRIALDGQINDGFVGVLSAAQLRELMAQLNLKSEVETALETIYAAAAVGRYDQVDALLADLLQRHPSDRRLAIEAATLYLDADRLEPAAQILATVSDYEKEYAAEAKAAKAQLWFKQLAQQPTGESELDAGFQQAIQAALQQDYARALDGLLTIVTKDRNYRSDGARKAMLAIFDQLGDMHPLTKDYRKRLMLALY